MKDFLNENGRRVAWLLTELEQQTENRLSDDTRQELLAEVAAHLDSAIRARLELGQEPLEAEREAVEQFGHPKAYVDELLAVHENSEKAHYRPWQWLRGERRTLVAFWAAMLFMIVFLVSKQTWLSAELASIVMKGFACLLAFFSYKARRIQLIPVSLAAIAGYVVLVLAISAFWTSFGSSYAVPNWEVGQVLAQDASILEQIKPPIAKLQHGLALHVQGISEDQIAKMSLADKDLFYSIPTLTSPRLGMFGEPSTGQPEIAQIVYVPTRSLQTAYGAWHRTGSKALSDLKHSREECDIQINGIKATQSRWLAVNLMTNLWADRFALPAFLGFGLLINILAGGLGWLFALPCWRRRRRAA